MPEPWYPDYVKAVAHHLLSEDDYEMADWSTIEVLILSEEGYHYSSYTYEDPNLVVVVRGKRGDGEEIYESLSLASHGPGALAALFRSFQAPA